MAILFAFVFIVGSFTAPAAQAQGPAPLPVFGVQTEPGQPQVISLPLKTGQQIAVTNVISVTGGIASTYTITGTFKSAVGFNLIAAGTKTGSMLTGGQYIGTATWNSGNPGANVAIESVGEVTVEFTSSKYAEYEVTVSQVPPPAPIATPIAKSSMSPKGVWMVARVGDRPVVLPFKMYHNDSLYITTTGVAVDLTFNHESTLFGVNGNVIPFEDWANGYFVAKKYYGTGTANYIVQANKGQAITIMMLLPTGRDIKEAKIGYFPVEPERLAQINAETVQLAYALPAPTIVVAAPTTAPLTSASAPTPTVAPTPKTNGAPPAPSGFDLGAWLRSLWPFK